MAGAEADAMLDRSAKQGIFKRIRLVIVDPQPIVLHGLKSILGAQQDFDVVASCRDGTSGLEAIRNLTPDAALLADTLPDLPVSEILAIAKAENLFTRLVFFTESGSESDRDLSAALASGASTAISKCASPDTMLRRLRLVTKRSASSQQFDLSPTGKGADGGDKTEKMLEQLTHRERQIVRLVSEGMSNKEIARELNVSPGTVKIHLYHIFQKLEITNRTVLAALALLRHPSGFGTLVLALLAFTIADDLKAAEANDTVPDDNGIGHAGEHAGYELWKKARHLIVGESGETPSTQKDFLAKLSQVTTPAAAMEVLRAVEHSAGAKPWKDHGPVGSSTPNLPAPLPRGTSDTQLGDLTAEHQFPRLASYPTSIHGGYGTFATLAGALIYALNDSVLAAQPHQADHASIDSFVVDAGQNATTKLAANAQVNHLDKSASGFPSHDSQPSTLVTTGNESVAPEGALSQMSHGAESDTFQKPVGLEHAGDDASIAGYGRDQLMGGNVDENVVYRSPAHSNSTSSYSAFNFASGSSRINLAAFGALAWLHMTAASKSIPPHTLAWIYNSASNETIVYVNPTDRALDIGDRGLLEVHLQGIVSIAESDFVDQREGAVVAVTLERLQDALTSATAIDGTVLGTNNPSIGASGSTLATAGVWTILADDGLGFQFGQARTGSGQATRFRTFTSDSAAATEESDDASAVSPQGSSIVPAPGATAAAVESLTLKSEPINAGTGILSTTPNVEPSVATPAGADRGNAQLASEPGSAEVPATASSEAGVKPGDGVGNGAEHHAPASDKSGKTAEPGGVERGDPGYSTSANAPEAADIVEPGVATAGSGIHANAQHASEPGSAKTAATEPTEAGVKSGNGVGNGAEHHAPASDSAREPAKTAEPGSVEDGNFAHSSSVHEPEAVGIGAEHHAAAPDAAPGPAKAAEPGGVEHGKSAHSSSANAPEAAEIVEPGVATATDAGRGNAQHASEPGSAKAPATELTEAGFIPDNGVGNGAEHHAPALDIARGSANTAEPGGVEHGNSGHSTSASTPVAADIVEPDVAAGGDAGGGNSQHASEPGFAKAAAAELTEADFKPDQGAEQPASDAARALAAVKTAEPAAVEHGNSGPSPSANAAEAADTPSVATGGNAEGGNSQHAAEPGSAKAVATDSAEADFIPGNNDHEQHAPALDAAAAVTTAEPTVVEHGKSGDDLPASSADAPEAAEVVEPSVATGGNAQQDMKSAAIVPEAEQPAQAATETGGADNELVFRFDSEAAPSSLVAAVEFKQPNNPIDPPGLLDQREALEVILSLVPPGLDEQHAADHGNSGAHHSVAPAHHDLLI